MTITRYELEQIAMKTLLCSLNASIEIERRDYRLFIRVEDPEFDNEPKIHVIHSLEG
jgi:hypothetical protein